MVRGYTPALTGMKQNPVAPDLVKLHAEHMAKRGLFKAANSLQPQTMDPATIQKDDTV